MTITIGRRVASVEELERPGDYCGPFEEVEGPDLTPSGRTAVWFLLPLHEGATKFDRPTPGSGLHRITSPPWEFRECPDGSLEVRASIACGRSTPDGEYWHGYLDEGSNWRQV